MEFKVYDKPKKGYYFTKQLIEKRGRRCECCKNSEWLSQPIKLEVHHINGDKRDNTEKNLQLLCPNCHAYTENYGTKNKNGNIVSDEKIIEAICSNFNARQALFSLGLSDAGNNYQRIRQILARNPEISFLSETKEEIKEKRCPLCNKIISKEAKYCVDCSAKNSRIVERPSRDELKQLIRENTFVSIASIYKVSDNAIRKWCDNYKLPRKKTEIKNYSDEEWEKI